MRIRLIIVLCLFGAKSMSQGKKVLRANRVKALTEVVITYQDGKETKHNDLYQRFDKNGNVIEEINYDKTTGKVKQRKLIRYNSQNDKIEETIFDANGKQSEKESYQYDSEGLKKEETLYNEHNELVSRSVFEYNKKDLRTEKKTYDAKGKLIQVKKYVYEY